MNLDMIYPTLDNLSENVSNKYEPTDKCPKYTCIWLQKVNFQVCHVFLHVEMWLDQITKGKFVHTGNYVSTQHTVLEKACLQWCWQKHTNMTYIGLFGVFLIYIQLNFPRPKLHNEKMTQIWNSKLSEIKHICQVSKYISSIIFHQCFQQTRFTICPLS